MKLFFVLTCAAAGLVGAYYGQPAMKGNNDAITVLITVMTVFAGFLVAIIAVLGDPALTPGESWRAASDRHEQIEAAVIRHTYLFYVYLLAIGFLFAGVLISGRPDNIVAASVKVWVERIYLFFGISAFLLTMWLPIALAKIQVKRSEAAIAARRLADGIPESREL